MLLSGNVIIDDVFTDGPAFSGKNISGRTPTVTDLPGAAYEIASGFDYDQQVIGPDNGSYSDSASFHNVGAAAISLASAGSYTRPAVFVVSAQIAFEVSAGYVSNAYLGFYSAIPSAGNQNDLENFSGLVLNSAGNLTLVNNGVIGQSVAFTGTYTPGTYTVLTYGVDTLTGSIYSVSLTGSNSDYSSFTTSAFMNTATAFSGIGGDNDPSGRVHFSSYQIATAPPPVAGSGVTEQSLGNVTIGAGTTVDLPAANRQADRAVNVVNSLSIAGSAGAWTGKLDLGENDLVVQNGNLPQITSQIASGYNSGSWSGSGITSSSAATDSTQLTTLGVILNNNGNNQPLYGNGMSLGLFDGQSPSATDVLVKYTYYGDANLDGKVDATDYAQIDNGFLNHLTGWFNGDFNYDGVINGSDYTLIDNAFNTQGRDLSSPTPAAKLVFNQLPSYPVAGHALSPAITVDVEDSDGNLLQTDSSTLTLSIASGNGSLSGTVSVAAVDGIATFSALSISSAGTYTLEAADGTLASAVSSPVIIAAKSTAGGLSNTDPFGVSASFSSTGDYSTWAPAVAAAGVKWVRLFPDWNQIEPSPGVFDWSTVDAVTSAAAANSQYVSGILYYNTNWVNSNTGTFPTNNLAAWSTFVSALVAHTAGKVEYWEVWNEPENFSSGGTPQQYASIVVSAYNAAKSADTYTQIGLNVASVDINYLEQAIESGAADHFDFISVHPYEVLATIDQGWEGDYLSIVPTIRKMLAAQDPANAGVPIWFSELGEQIGQVDGPVTVTATSQANDLIKAYSMAIAEGVARIDWYQGEDDSGAPGYGLLDTSGDPTLSYITMQSITTSLGAAPQYQGWLQLNGQDDGFVFQAATTSVMALWAPLAATDNISFDSNVQVENPLTGSITTLVANTSLALTNAPILILGVPTSLLAQAQANQNHPFPWGGDYSNASSVSILLGTVNTDSGLHELSPNQTSQAVTAYGSPARLVNDSYADIYQDFEVDPNFISYLPSTVEITVVARRDPNDDPASFQIGYESTTGILQQTTEGSWAIPGNDQWYSHTFTITDAEFDSKWGFNFFLNSVSPSNGEFFVQSISVS